MTRGRDIEMLLLPMVATVPLYFTQTLGIAPLIAFHLVMAGIVLRVATGRSPELIPATIMRGLGVAYILFYIIDAAAISRSAIAASTHLVLFIAAFQPIESVRTNNDAQRLLTASLIFVASLATATHISILLFVIVFAFLMFRQMMYVSHVETVQSVGREYALTPASRAALFYLVGTTVIGAALFPLLPRLRNPVVQGFTGSLTNATTGLSDSIDFNYSRTSTPDPTVVARVWMGQQAIPFFTPLRLRAAVYDAFSNNTWLQTRGEFREVRPNRTVFQIARPVGFARTAIVQQRLIKSSRLFLPVGTYAVSNISQLWEGPTHDSYLTMQGRGEMVSYQVSMAREIEPLRAWQPKVVRYPVTPAVAGLAKKIVGNETTPDRQAAAIEKYMSQRFIYVQRPEQIGGRPMTTDDFLLRVRRGHCEYFAAGMVALMSSLNVPARIVGGFYGGRMNPLTGYFIIRREDAHAWVEVWDGARWTTFDPTPPALRPGDAQAGLLNRYVAALSDSVNYFWDRYILTYGLGDQIALAADLIARMRQTAIDTRHNMSEFRRALGSRRALGALAAVLALVAAAILFARRRRSIFDLIADRLRGFGIEVNHSTTVEEALVLLRVRDPQAAEVFAQIIALYEEERFSPRHERARVATIRRRLQELRAVWDSREPLHKSLFTSS
ncbi:MAG TPA: transglutaminaseTgpA domain-containing protein [Thermoanaerobaculia bacterium]|nr:transglutaminaseTgpA domain-containing protein [Thermoanaerobaculia bacterium]